MAETIAIVKSLQDKLGTTICPKKGTRVSISVQGVTATGTVTSYFGWDAVEVELDGTGQKVTVPTSVLAYA